MRAVKRILVKSGTGGVAFKEDESGATAIEYGLIASGIALAIFSSVYAIGPTLAGIFQDVLNLF